MIHVKKVITVVSITLFLALSASVCSASKTDEISDSGTATSSSTKVSPAVEDTVAQERSDQSISQKNTQVAAGQTEGSSQLAVSALKASAVSTDSPAAVASNKKSSIGVSSMDWVKAILGLTGIIVLIFLAAWFVKRFTGLAPGNQQHMRVISALPVGTRERIALISVADKQLLVGITQHNINLLHSFDEPVVNKNDKTGTDFASRLQGMLNKGTSA